MKRPSAPALPALSADSRLPLYQQLRDTLAAAIRAGIWKPGEALPAEHQLAAHHGVAYGTVRKAIDALVAEGLLERSQGRGTFVRRADFASSLFRFFRLRQQDGSVPMPAGRVLHREERRAPAAVADYLAVPAGAPVIYLRRLRWVEDTPLLVEDIWLERVRFQRLLEIPAGNYGDLLYPLYERECGLVVTQATEDLGIASADADTAMLLGIAPGAPVVVVDRLARGFDGAPLEYRRSRGAGERFRYRVEIR